MTEYDFTQQVDYPQLLVEAIQSSSITTPLVNIQTQGSGNSMQVSLFFNDILSATDQTTLNSIMSAYVNNLPASIVTLNQITNDINFGMSIIAKFGAANRIANLTTSQVVQIAQQLAPIQSLLMSGSISTALTVMQTLTPNEVLTQNIINYYIILLQNYLNSGT